MPFRVPCYSSKPAKHGSPFLLPEPSTSWTPETKKSLNKTTSKSNARRRCLHITRNKRVALDKKTNPLTSSQNLGGSCYYATAPCTVPFTHPPTPLSSY